MNLEYLFLAEILTETVAALFGKSASSRFDRFKFCPSCKARLAENQKHLVGAVLICDKCDHYYAKTKQGLCLIG